MNVTSRVKGCSQRLYNNMRKETKRCKWKAIPAVWKERAFPTADSHSARREMFFVESEMLLPWSLNPVTSQFKPVKNSDSTSSRSYLMLTTYVLLHLPCGPFLLLIMCHIPHPTLHNLTTLILSGEELKCEAPHYANFSFFRFLPSLRSNTLLGIFF